ncbi:MAG: NADH-quinone oxidoreductase subunit A [Actinomycetota bacterium]|jgi:NADH:ubiquinone oxidoreductase subunit 3 (subunit A)|nr:NADH-quinone oxidoreductase subunit A [Actinomycetota bacterium]
MQMDYLIIGAFVLIGLVFTAATVMASNVLSPSAPSEAKGETYECGSTPVGPPWVQFRVGYYVYALLFLVFDIETVFLYPWAVAFGKPGLFILVEMVIFIAILAAGLAYAWKEGALQWR